MDYLYNYLLLQVCYICKIELIINKKMGRTQIFGYIFTISSRFADLKSEKRDLDVLANQLTGETKKTHDFY